MQSQKDRFHDLLIGFEEFNFSEQQIKAAIHDLEQAERDYMSCLYCKVGRVEKERCRTSVGSFNYKGYFAMSSNGCNLYRQPSFAVHDCPGPVERRELIARAKAARKGEALVAGNADQNKKNPARYTER